MKREIALIVFVSLVVAGLASASKVGWSTPSTGAWSHNDRLPAAWFGLGRYSRQIDRSFELSPDTRLEVRAGSIDVSLVRGSGTTLRVHGTVRASDRSVVDGLGVTMQQSDGRRIIAFTVPQRNGFGLRFFDAHLVLAVPQVAAVAVVGTSSDVSAADQTVPLDIQTSSGDVTVERAAAGVAIKTSSGDVIVRRAAALQTQTTSGDVRVNDVGGSLSSRSTSGDLTAVLANGWSGTSLAMHTSSGDIDLKVPARFRGVLHTATNSGDVSNEAKLPTGADARHSGRLNDQQRRHQPVH